MAFLYTTNLDLSEHFWGEVRWAENQKVEKIEGRIQKGENSKSRK